MKSFSLQCNAHSCPLRALISSLRALLCWQAFCCFSRFFVSSEESLCFSWRILFCSQRTVLSVDTDSPDSRLCCQYENFVLLLKILILFLKDQILHPVWLNHAMWEEMANSSSNDKFLIFLKEYLSFESDTFSLSCISQGLGYGPGGWFHPS